MSVNRDLVIVAIPLVPSLLALVLRRKDQVERRQPSEFRTLFSAQKVLIDNCEKRCQGLEARLLETEQKHDMDLHERQQMHNVEMVAIQEKHRIEVTEWQKKHSEIKMQLETLETFFRRIGFGHLLDQAQEERERLQREGP